MIWPDIAFYSLEWLGETLLATTILIALVLLVRKPVSRLFGPQLAYWLWLIPFLRLLLPPIIREEPALGSSASAMLPYIAHDASYYLLVSSALPGVWFAGTFIMLGATLATHMSFRSRLFACYSDHSYFRGFRVVSSPFANGPLAIGLFRPTIVVPDDFSLKFSPEEQAQVLRHEAEHLRHGDLWANLAAIIFLSVHWFNPASWMAWRFFRLDQEGACDERSTRHADRKERADYATALAKAAYGSGIFPARLVAPMVAKCELKQRLMLLCRARSYTEARKAAGLMAVFGLSWVALVSTASVVQARPISHNVDFKLVRAGYQAPVSAMRMPQPFAQSEKPEPPIPFAMTEQVETELSRIFTAKRRRHTEMCSHKLAEQNAA